MQTIVELFLKSPGKLAVFNLTRPKQKNIRMNLRLRRRIADFDFYTFGGGASAKDKQRMLVACKFGAHFFSEGVHGLPAAVVLSNSPRAVISAQTFSKAASARASNRTK